MSIPTPYGRASKKRGKRLKRPPGSMRYCLGCQEMRGFKYDPGVGHSACKVCGGHLSTKEKPEDDPSDIVKRFFP